MKKAKQALKKVVQDVKNLDYHDPVTLLSTALFLAVPIAALLIGIHVSAPKTDIRASSVMITNRAGNSGGTGIILKSTESESTILTNDHVCNLVKDDGGLVRSQNADYQVASTTMSQVSDLCLITVLADLGVNTAVSKHAPNFYDSAVVSGHPALMPNVISTGHFSGRQIIQVVIGFKPCDANSPPEMGIFCAILGGIPIVRSYESVLVTATIMPGSSGSGVYTSRNELGAVVFAGSSDFGYAWTVPHEQIVNFLENEAPNLETKEVSQELNLFGNQQEKRNQFKDAVEKCRSVDNNSVPLQEKEKETISKFCAILKRDALWRK